MALPAPFVLAAAYHAWQSLGHVTPMVFDDELLYGKLSQSIAAGHGLSIRGEPFFFPAPLGPLVQSPVWLLSSMTDAYTAAKILNAAVMSTAVFPAYWLARRIVRPSFALLTAAAAVATPAMVYHAFLMSEALAYPVFLLTVAVLAKALAEPSRRMASAVPAVSLVAVTTRVQFLILPLVYVAAVALCGRGNYRRHALPAALGSHSSAHSSSSLAHSARTEVQRTCVRRSGRLRIGRSSTGRCSRTRSAWWSSQAQSSASATCS